MLEPFVIRVELDNIRHSVLQTIHDHADTIKTLATAALERELQPERIAQLVRYEINNQLERVVRDAVRNALKTAVEDVVYDEIRTVASEAAADVVARLKPT